MTGNNMQKMCHKKPKLDHYTAKAENVRRKITAEGLSRILQRAGAALGVSE